MADGMGIGVIGTGSNGTTAGILHDMRNRGPGDARYSGVLDVSLIANGGVNDTATGTTGEATLALQVDPEIEVLNIDSSVNVGGSGSAPDDRPSAGDYENTLMLNGDGNPANSTVEAINVSGSAKVDIAGTYGIFGSLLRVDATGNSGGVTMDASSASVGQAVELLGGSGDDEFVGSHHNDAVYGNGGSDMLYGWNGNDEIRGGSGGDKLSGGAGNDTFVYTSPSDSQVALTAQGEMYGFDEISDWGNSAGNTDVISLGQTLFSSLSGTIKEFDAANPNRPEITTYPFDSIPDTLLDYLGNGDGAFETETPNNPGLGTTVTHNPIAFLDEWSDPTPGASKKTWILIDVDGNGDFDAAIDMAIRLIGDIVIDDNDFSA